MKAVSANPAKKKKSRAKKIIAIVVVVALVAAIVAFVMTRDNDADEIKLADIPIITFFGITEPSTTEADIIAVERDLNNVLITDGYAVKLFLAPEERYDSLLASAMEMMDVYMENNSKKAEERLGFEYSFDYANSSFTYKCDEEAVTPAVVYNQDTIIEMLDDGQEIYPNAPSMDVVLINSYEKYYEMAADNAFTRLNSNLTDIAKSLNQSIPAAFLDAVKLNSGGDIYGIPCVQPVGKYEFMVYDKDLLDKYGVSKNQLLSIEDLDPYLKEVAADGEVDVIPLLNAPESSPLELSSGKSIGITFNGALDLPFLNDDYQDYYATIARYRSLGFMGEVGADIEKSDFAVAFFSGTESEVKALSEKTGKNLVYNKFSMPYATSEEVGEAIFCVCAERKYSVSKADNGVDFVTKLNGPKSQTDIKNILLYGAMGINYSLSEIDGTVEYANGNTYMMDNLYTGHTLHARPSADKGVSEDWIAEAQAQNLDLVSSKLSGFMFEPRMYNVGGERVRGVDYLAVLDEVVSGMYSDYINGITCGVDLADFNSRVDDLIREDIGRDVQAEFEAEQEALLTEQYSAELHADTQWMADHEQEAAQNSLVELKDAVQAVLKEELTARYNSLGVTDAEEIATRLAKDITDELIEERLHEDYTDKDIEDAAAEKLDSFVNNEVAVRIAEYKRGEEYKQLVNTYVTSEEFSAAVEERFTEQRDAEYYEVLDSEIEDNVYNYAEEIEAKIDEALAAANEKFIADNNISEAEAGEMIFCSTFSDLRDTMLREQYYELKGEPK